MLVDGFIFFNELDLLKIRLKELYPVVDKFVLVEGDFTFRGNKKSYNFENNKHLYVDYLDKIHYIKLQDDGGFGDDITSPWKREYWSRNKMIEGFEGDDPEDILIISDVDEIPSRQAVLNLNPQPLVALGMPVYVYKLNLFDAYGASSKAVRRKALTTPDEIRHRPPIVYTKDCGWHFSSLGTPEQISEKFKSFSHSEIDIDKYTNPDRIRDRIDRQVDPLDRGNLHRVEIDNTWPIEVLNNREYWEKFIC